MESNGKPNGKVKKSLFNSFLSKRSIRVEPHPYDDQNTSDLIPANWNSNRQQSISENSTPIKQNRTSDGKTNKFWRRHNSSHNVNNISLDTSSSHSSYLRTPKKDRKLNKQFRHSHPFSSLCCSKFDNKSGTPPTSTEVKCNLSLDSNHLGHGEDTINTLVPQQSPMGNNSRILKTEAEIHALANNNKSQSITSDSNLNDNASLSFERLPLGARNNEFPTSVSQPQSPTTTIHEGFFSDSAASEIQPGSIAMSACRSRLRQKLLPPGTKMVVSQQEQHFSSPNISTEKTADKSLLAHRNSRSYSYDLLTAGNRPGSADSLAKNSLVAAQVLNLIPTEKARERSYLANNLAVSSLLGPTELDRVLPGREIKIFVGTWNMNGEHPPKQMNDFVLPSSIEHVPDLIVIGTQESCSERFEWEVILQETLGPSHVLLHSTSLGTLHLAAFIRRDLIWYCSVPEDDSLSVRTASAFRTKGAVAISFSLFGTSMLFVTSHLTAHQQKVKERVSDVKRIIHSLDLPRNLHIRTKNKDVTQNYDAVFWFGDLNFRLGEPREKLLKWIESTQFPLPSHLPHGYMHTDQLKSILANGAAFKDFKEANITFPPTYKYDPGTQKFDTSSKQRAPAYTDRILYKYKSAPLGLRRGSNLTNFLHSSVVECLAYDSVPSIVSSDHKPVWALFKASIRPGIDSIPLAAGLFNRDVYIEGMKRRLNNKNPSSSTVCCIQ